MFHSFLTVFCGINSIILVEWINCTPVDELIQSILILYKHKSFQQLIQYFFNRFYQLSSMIFS